MFQHILSFCKKNKTIIIVLLLFFVMRLYKLDQTNLLHDERDIFLSGYSIGTTGRDLTGKSFPLMFYQIDAKNPMLAIYFNAIFSFLLPFKSVFFARFIYVLLTTVVPFLFYQLISTITKNRQLAFVSALMWCISPWVFHATRLGFEANLALVILLLALNAYLGGKKAWGYFFFILLTYAYSGTRALLPFALVLAEFWHFLRYKNIKKFLIITALNITLAVILLGTTVIIEPEMTADRARHEVVFFADQTAQEVNFKRTTAQAPELIKKIMNNKLTVSFDYIINTFMVGLDPSHLFKKGDPSPINGNTASGQFLPVFLPFYYLGFMYLGKRLKKELLFPLLLIPLGFMPALVNSLSPSFGIRGLSASLGFSYLLALGAVYLYKLSRSWSKVSRWAGASILAAVFIVSLGYFYYNFFSRRFTLVSELFNEHERQLALTLIKQDKKITVYSEHPKELFFSYFLFDKKLTAEEVQKEVQKGGPTYRTAKINFMSCPPVKKQYMFKNSVFSADCLGQEMYKKLLQQGKQITSIPRYDISQLQAYYFVE